MNLNVACPWWLAVAIAGSVAALARRRGSLRTDGAVVALFVGAVSLRAHVGWGVLLMLWFVLASILSRLVTSNASSRFSSIIDKGDRRDAWQVLANGGVFALASIVEIMRLRDAVVSSTSTNNASTCSALLAVAGAASLAASGADTWSTEIGMRFGGTPWSLRSRTAVAPGTSGAISLAGLLGGLVGACVIAGLAATLGVVLPSQAITVCIGGVAGATIDTVVGALLQERRKCPSCGEETEQMIHVCGTSTVLVGGMARLDNDVVNLFCTIAGAIVAAGLDRTLPSAF